MNKVRALKSNKLKVLAEVCRGQNITRTEIASAIGMTPMSISTIVKELMEEDILVEAEGRKKETSCGRKPAILELSPNCPCVLALNFSRRALQVAIMDFRASLRKELTRECPVFRTPDEVRDFFFETIDRLLEGETVRIAGIGFSSFGPINTERGVILSPKRFNNIGDIELKEPLEKRYGVPCVMIHDATASALAEQRLGHNEVESLVYVLLTSGIGCGLIINGELWGGENGLSGELGHLTINMDGPECECSGNGCLESYVSIDLITDEINRTHSFDPALSWHDIVALFNSEQGMFRQDFEKYCHYMAVALTGLSNLLDIGTFVLEYEGQECGDRIERLIEDEMKKHIVAGSEKNVRILKSTYGSLSGVIGACSAVVDDITSGRIDMDI